MSGTPDVEQQKPEAAGRLAPTVRRLGWLHFANDFTLDFLTPLLPSAVPLAWIGAMEGAADAVGQGLKLFTGRASDRSGRRVPWVRAGYAANAIARPLTALGMFFGWPLWIIACRIGDRVGKGVRGSATDALVADWTDAGSRARAYASMRTMDHLGATIGGLAAAGATYIWAEQVSWLVAALVIPMAAMLWLSAGLRDRPVSAAHAPSPGYWPRDRALVAPLAILALAALGRLGPLLVLAQIAGFANASEPAWPLWQLCLAWAALALAQAGAASLAGILTSAFGPRTFLVAGWLAGAAVFAALALCGGTWLIVAGLGFGFLAGFTEGSEKTYLADIAAKHERAVTFGAYALLAAAATFVGNGLCGWALMRFGAVVFLAPACALAAAAALLAVRRR
jgi:MFS family permease